MAPSNTANNGICSGGTHAEFLCDLSVMDAFTIQAAHFLNLLIRQLGNRIMGALLGSGWRVPLSTLPHHVMRIGPVGSDEQVVRPNAGRIVATMKNALPFGDRAKGDMPGNAAGDLWHFGQPKATALNAAISLPVAASRPFPALTGFINHLPEVKAAHLLASPPPDATSLTPTRAASSAANGRNVSVLWRSGMATAQAIFHRSNIYPDAASKQTP